MILAPVSPSPTVVVHLTQSASGWVPYVVGAASTLITALIVQLVVQFWVVPRVETRKRREDRWERDVRALADLVAMRLPEVANDTWAAQALLLDARRDRDGAYTEEQFRHLAREAGKAVNVYGGLVASEIDVQIDRVLSINRKVPELAKLEKLYKAYQMQSILVRALPEDGNRSLEELDNKWDKERDARKALTAQVKLLANMRHPPR